LPVDEGGECGRRTHEEDDWHEVGPPPDTIAALRYRQGNPRYGKASTPIVVE
jgi:hypothetical protein